MCAVLVCGGGRSRVCGPLVVGPRVRAKTCLRPGGGAGGHRSSRDADCQCASRAYIYTVVLGTLCRRNTSLGKSVVNNGKKSARLGTPGHI